MGNPKVVGKIFKFEIGSIVKETVTGFEGVVMARCEYATGCLHYELQPRKIDKDGKPIEGRWYDETRLVLTKKKAVPIPVTDKSPGSKAPGCK